MKQKLKRFMAGFMAMLTLVGTLFTNGTTAFAASPQANIAFWNASVKNSGEVSELKPGYNHGKILYSILDGNSAYCMNFGLRADGGQLMNSYDDASTSMSAQQRKLLSYCLYYGFNSTQKAAPSNSQCDEYIATQAMVWVIVADIFGTGSGDSAARKLCNTAPSPDSSYSYYLFKIIDYFKVDANTILNVAEGKKENSIDSRLELMDYSRKAYFQKIFNEMLDNAEMLVS